MCKNEKALLESVYYIKINQEFEIFTEFLYATKSILYGLVHFNDALDSDDDYIAFFWEYCLNIGVLFEVFGREQAFVTPYCTELSEFSVINTNGRLLYTKESPTHKVILFPKRKEGAICYEIDQRISWSKNDAIYVVKTIPYMRDYLASDGTYICEHGIVCSINGEIHSFAQSECDFYLVPIDPNTTWIPKQFPYSHYPPKDRLEFTSFQ